MKIATNQRKSFTLMEIMVAVAVVGILMSVAVPAFIKAFQGSKSTRFVSDLKTVSNAFEFYAFENGIYPPDAPSGVVPDGMGGYLRDFPWTLATCIGGVWDWENNEQLSSSVTVTGHKVTQGELEKVDDIIDDGSLSSGLFTGNMSTCFYTLTN